MAVAWYQEFTIVDHSTTAYDDVSARLGLDENPAEGLIAHTAGFDDDNGVFRIFDVWESRAHGERFMTERLKPILDEMMAGTSPPPGSGPTREGFYELHDVVPG